jgi:hypothetical protein
MPGIEPGTSGSVVRNSGHQTIQAALDRTRAAEDVPNNSDVACVFISTVTFNRSVAYKRRRDTHAQTQTDGRNVRVEVFKAVTMKNAVF